MKTQPVSALTFKQFKKLPSFSPEKRKVVVINKKKQYAN